MTNGSEGRLAGFGKTIRKIVLISLTLMVVGFILWTWISLTYVYSTGERAGFVQKISHKGWIFKTWEGELAMVSIPGTTPQMFDFTVRDDAVVGKIQELLGQRVALTYEQHVGVPGSLFGETQYFVVDVRLAK